MSECIISNPFLILHLLFCSACMCPTRRSLLWCDGLSAQGDPIESCDDVGEWMLCANGSVIGLFELLNELSNSCNEIRYRCTTWCLSRPHHLRIYRYKFWYVLTDSGVGGWVEILTWAGMRRAAVDWGRMATEFKSSFLMVIDWFEIASWLKVRFCMYNVAASLLSLTSKIVMDLFKYLCWI